MYASSENLPAEEMNPPAEPFSPAPLSRRFGAQLLDSALGLLVIHLSTLPIQFAYNHGFGELYLAICQSFVIGWAVLKDAWWPGQSLGKRVARIFIAASPTGERATRLRSVGRQAIFTVLLTAINLAAYRYLFPTGGPEMIRMAIVASVLSAAAPIRVLAVFLPSQTPLLDPGKIPQLLILSFLIVEALVVFARRDRKRTVDLLARTEVLPRHKPRTRPN
jgi:hypothetical protein